MYSVVSVVTVETVAKGFQTLLISDARYLAGYMSTMSWLIWYRPDHMHIKAGLGHVALATEMPTGSLTKAIHRVDNGRGLAVRSRVRQLRKTIQGPEVEVYSCPKLWGNVACRYKILISIS
jgi:hypothetical protein